MTIGLHFGGPALGRGRPRPCADSGVEFRALSLSVEVDGRASGAALGSDGSGMVAAGSSEGASTGAWMATGAGTPARDSVGGTGSALIRDCTPCRNVRTKAI